MQGKKIVQYTDFVFSFLKHFRFQTCCMGSITTD